MTKYACKECKRILSHKKCPYCGKGAAVSKHWKGMVIIFDSKKSRIAKELNISSAGRYAMRVR